MAQVTKVLQDTVEQNPHIEEIHFSADQHYHFRVFECDDKKNKNLYNRLQEIPEVSSGGIATGKFILAPIKDKLNPTKDDARFLITKTLTRAEVLSATPVAESEAAKPQISKTLLLEALEITEEDLKLIQKAKKK